MLERLAGILRRRREEEEEYEPERLPIRRCMPDYHMGLYEEEIIEREVAEAVPEGELSQPDDQAGSMADHFH